MVQNYFKEDDEILEIADMAPPLMKRDSGMRLMSKTGAISPSKIIADTENRPDSVRQLQKSKTFRKSDPL